MRDIVHAVKHIPGERQIFSLNVRQSDEAGTC